MKIYSAEGALKEMCSISSEERSRICLSIQQLDGIDNHLIKDNSDALAHAHWGCLNELYEQFRCTVFRGQRDSGWELQPSCMRDDLGNDIASNVIRCTRVNMLQQKITSTALYKRFNTVTVRGPMVQSEIIYDDPWALAQHLGLSTSLIDYTSNPEVAMFFACTKHTENGFEPLTSEDIGVCPYGRIFLDEYVMSNDLKTPMKVISPLLVRRPRRQNGFLIHHSECNKERSIVFEHNQEFSEQMFDKFEGGKLLFPDVESNVEDLASEIKGSKVLLENALNRSVTRDVDFEKLLGDIRSMGFSISSEDIFKDFDMNEEDVEYYTPIDDIITQCNNNHCLSMEYMYDFFSVLQLSRKWMRVAYGLILNLRICMATSW